MNKPDPKPRQRVAVVYHFFPHYREAVMRELLNDPACAFELVGGLADPEGSIRAWTPPAAAFIPAPCRRLPGNILWQSGLFRIALAPYAAIVFLGNAQWPATWAAAWVARRSGKRVLFWTHGWTRRDRGWTRIVRNIFYRQAHGLLLYGERARAIALEQGFAPENLYVVYNSLNYPAQKAIRQGADPARLAAIRRHYVPEPDGALVVCTARLTGACRFDLLLDALALLKTQGRAVAALLVGDGPQREDLAARAAALGVTVHFHGACYEEQTLGELIMAADVCVSPGKVGLTAMHSLAYGIPVITHDNPDRQAPEVEAIQPGLSGEFFREGDATDLARVIAAWTARPWPDPATRQRCVDIIESRYNPAFQNAMIQRAVLGLPPLPLAARSRP